PHLADALASKAGGFLSSSRQSPPVMANLPGAGAAYRHHSGSDRVAAKTPLPHHWLVVVFGNARAGDRPGAGGRTSAGRSLYLPSAGRPLSRADLDDCRSFGVLAASPGDFRRRGSSGDYRFDLVRIDPGLVLEK